MIGLMKMQTKHKIVKVEWDTTSEESGWVRLFDESDLPEIVTVHDYVEDDDIADWLSARYGFLVLSWTTWSAVEEAKTMADNLYSGDPV